MLLFALLGMGAAVEAQNSETVEVQTLEPQSVGLQSEAAVAAPTGGKPFERLGVYIDVGTTGIGLDVATSLNNHFVLKAGFSMLPFALTNTFDLAAPDFDLSGHPLYSTLLSEGLPTKSADVPSEVDVEAKLGLMNGRILVDYYPWASSGFHLTAGAYIGQSHLVSIEGRLPQKLNDAIDRVKKYEADNPGAPKFDLFPAVDINGESIDTKELNGKVDASVDINTVKPYLGLGFGRSIPKRRIGFQFELGAMYLGMPTLGSTNAKLKKALNKDGGDFNIAEYAGYLQIYPVISFKLTGRIF